MLFFNSEIIQDFKKELEHIKKIKEPKFSHNQDIFISIYLQVKTLEVANLIFERWKYGFDIECDIAAFTNKTLPFNIKSDQPINKISSFTFEKILNTEINKEINIDERIQLTADEINTFFVLVGKKDKIEYEDILKLRQLNIIA